MTSPRWRQIAAHERLRRGGIAVLVLGVAALLVWLWSWTTPERDMTAGELCRQHYRLANNAAESSLVDVERPMIGKADAGRLTCAALRAQGLVR
jgi:hypothetical protein